MNLDWYLGLCAFMKNNAQLTVSVLFMAWGWTTLFFLSVCVPTYSSPSTLYLSSPKEDRETQTCLDFSTLERAELCSSVMSILTRWYTKTICPYWPVFWHFTQLWEQTSMPGLSCWRIRRLWWVASQLFVVCGYRWYETGRKAQCIYPIHGNFLFCCTHCQHSVIPFLWSDYQKQKCS